jgi:hypothetical protein
MCHCSSAQKQPRNSNGPSLSPGTAWPHFSPKSGAALAAETQPHLKTASFSEGVFGEGNTKGWLTAASSWRAAELYLNLFVSSSTPLLPSFTLSALFDASILDTFVSPVLFLASVTSSVPGCW